MKINDKRLFEKPEYNKVQDRECEKTENSDDKRKPDKKRFTKSSTEADTENKTDNREETAQQETPNLNQKMDIDPEDIPDTKVNQNNGDALNDENHISNLSGNKIKKKKANSPDSQTNETTETKNKSKKIFIVVRREHDTSIVPEDKHDPSAKDNQRIKLVRWAIDSVFKVLKYRSKRERLVLKKVNVERLFGNIRKQRWFVKRKLKYIFASKHENKKVIKKMIKKDFIFKGLVEMKFEYFYKNYFLVYNMYLSNDNITSFHLAHLKTFENYLEKEKENKYTEKEIEKYIKKLKETGFDLINEINGEGFYDPRCVRKKIRTKICFIRYKK